MEVTTNGTVNLKFSERIEEVVENIDSIALLIEIMRDDEPVPEILVDWSLLSVSNSNMSLQLEWTDYRLVSSDQDPDDLKVTFIDNDLFQSQSTG